MGRTIVDSVLKTRQDKTTTHLAFWTTFLGGVMKLKGVFSVGVAILVVATPTIKFRDFVSNFPIFIFFMIGNLLI